MEMPEERKVILATCKKTVRMDNLHNEICFVGGITYKMCLEDCRKIQGRKNAVVLRTIDNRGRDHSLSPEYLHEHFEYDNVFFDFCLL